MSAIKWTLKAIGIVAVGEPRSVQRKTWYRQVKHRAGQRRYIDVFRKIG